MFEASGQAGLSHLLTPARSGSSLPSAWSSGQYASPKSRSLIQSFPPFARLAGEITVNRQCYVHSSASVSRSLYSLGLAFQRSNLAIQFPSGHLCSSVVCRPFQARQPSTAARIYVLCW